MLGEYYEVRLVDDDDMEVGVGEVGEIVVRPKKPYIMMTEYYKMPDKTLEIYGNLWFHTGDYAKKDEDGYFYFVDRKKVKVSVLIFLGIISGFTPEIMPRKMRTDTFTLWIVKK